MDTVQIGPVELRFEPLLTKGGGFVVCSVGGAETGRFALTPEEWQEFTAEVRQATDPAGHKGTPRTRLTAFLFRLMRDSLATGIVEYHVRVVEHAHEPDGVAEFLGAHGLALYAQELAERLVP